MEDAVEDLSNLTDIATVTCHHHHAVITATVSAGQHCTALRCVVWDGMIQCGRVRYGTVPVGVSGVLEGAGLASLVHDGLALEELQEV